MLQNFNLRGGLSGACLVAMLSGCAGSPLSTPPAPSIGATQARTHRPLDFSWTDPTASGQDLLYITNGEDAYVYTYPQGHLVGTLTGFFAALGECVDSAGDVFITTLANKYDNSGIIYEYAHGGTEPIADLDDPAGGYGCAIDPTSGNLAVANMADSNNPYGHYGDVAVYADAQGDPTMYYSSEFVSFGLCAYDSKGNLYLSATNGEYGDQDQFVRLAAGRSSFEQISLNATLYSSGGPPSVQWDGRYMTVSSTAYREPAYLYRLHITGDSATVVGTTTLSSRKNTFKSGQIWIQGKRVLGADFFKGKGGVDSWSYPNAGKPRTIIADMTNFAPFGIAVSPAARQ
jgi:hypothetical protein